MKESITYENNVFTFEPSWRCRALTGISVQAPILTLSESILPDPRYGKNSYSPPFSVNGAELVKVVRFEKDASYHPFCHVSFPNLEKIEVDEDNPYFHTDGRCLYSKNAYALLADPCGAISASPLRLRKEVKAIYDGAFKTSRCTDITFENPDIHISKKAFTDSAYLKAQTGELIIAGNRLIEVKGRGATLDLRGHYLRDISPSIFNGKNPPVSMVCEDLPDRLFPSVGNSELSVLSSLSLSRKASFVDAKDFIPYSSLKDLSFWEEHPFFQVTDGIVYSKDQKRLIYCPPYLMLQSFQVPEGVESIERYAFSGQKYVTSISLPSSVKRLGKGAFSHCKKLVSVHLSDALTKIPKYAFYQCTSLYHVDGGRCLQSIGAAAFQRCPLQDFSLPDTLRRIGEEAFWRSEACLYLPGRVTAIGKEAFCGVDMVHASLPLPEDFLSSMVRIETAYNNQKVRLFTGFTLYLKDAATGEENPFTFPEELKESGRELLQLLLTQASLRPRDLLDAGLLPHCKEGSTRSQLLFQVIVASPEEDFSSYYPYLRKISRSLAFSFLEDRDLRSLRYLLDHDLCSKETLNLLQEEANEMPYPEATAYLLEKKEQQRKKKKNPERKTVFPL